MSIHTITRKKIRDYREVLQQEERADATISKYCRDLEAFYVWLKRNHHVGITKGIAVSYKTMLLKEYAPNSVNSILSAINGFFSYLGWYEYRVKPIKIQTKAYADSEHELTKAEYYRLVRAAEAKGNARLSHLLQTICATGIRVSEVKYITTDAIAAGCATVNNKGKVRTVLLPKELCTKLQKYCRSHQIHSGSVFITKGGAPLDRSNIWAMMKALCSAAGVSARKVFPHNLRHLFAKCFYQMEHDLDHLAAVLGHSNVNTTRVYTRTTGAIYRHQVEKLALIL